MHAACYRFRNPKYFSSHLSPMHRLYHLHILHYHIALCTFITHTHTHTHTVIKLSAPRCCTTSPDSSHPPLVQTHNLSKVNKNIFHLFLSFIIYLSALSPPLPFSLTGKDARLYVFRLSVLRRGLEERQLVRAKCDSRENKLEKTKGTLTLTVQTHDSDAIRFHHFEWACCSVWK